MISNVIYVVMIPKFYFWSIISSQNSRFIYPTIYSLFPVRSLNTYETVFSKQFPNLPFSPWKIPGLPTDIPTSVQGNSILSVVQAWSHLTMHTKSITNHDDSVSSLSPSVLSTYYSQHRTNLLLSPQNVSSMTARTLCLWYIFTMKTSAVANRHPINTCWMNEYNFPFSISSQSLKTQTHTAQKGKLLVSREWIFRWFIYYSY